MKKLKVFETFAGIGSQHKALEYLKSKYGYDYEVVATSEWDIDAIIAYASIHYPKFDASRSEYAERERERDCDLFEGRRANQSKMKTIWSIGVLFNCASWRGPGLQISQATGLSSIATPWE